MSGRPTRTVIALEVAALAAAVAAGAWRAADADWDLALLGSLLALAVVSDLMAVRVSAHRVKLSGSFLAIVTAAALLGETPAAVVGVATIVIGWLSQRYEAEYLLINLVTYSWFPLLAGAGFQQTVRSAGIEQSDPAFFVLVVVIFVVALAINFGFIAAYTKYAEGVPFKAAVSQDHLPLLAAELTPAVLAVGVTYAYIEVGLAAVGLFAIVLLTFQHLLSQLLISKERADELELRAKQLAGFQVALLSALLRTLDLRDRVTARHSASVARCARAIAAAAGADREQQELAHSAGLLHDIGKFVLPDEILKRSTPLTEADWEEIRRHPAEGARIVSQIDGYQPIGEVILAHHERVDGLGYPRGLRGEEIPWAARVVAVADAYDAMTAREWYTEPVSSHEAMAELRRCAGTQFDPEVVEVFIEVLARQGFEMRTAADFDAELALDQRISAYLNANSGEHKAPPPAARTDRIDGRHR